MSKPRTILLAAAAAALAAALAFSLPRPETETVGRNAPQAEAACRQRTFEGSAFTVCKFDARTDRLRVVYQAADGQPLRRFAALEQSLGADARKVRFAMNAGMFDEEGAPIGLFVDDGKERHRINLREGSGNFHLLPNGVFAQDAHGRVHVTTSTSFTKAVPDVRWATQSGPMLVIDGKLHPRFDTDGPSRLIRNGVGVSDSRTAWFAISDEGVSFGRFARLFRDEIGCANALFLDGSVSSLWDPASGRRDEVAELGPMMVVSR